MKENFDAETLKGVEQQEEIVIRWEDNDVEGWEEDDLLDTDCGEGWWLVGYLDADAE